MERAGRIIGKLQLKPVEVAGVKTYHLAPRAWSAAVGKTIAAHTRPVFLDGTRLIVEVEDRVWQAQLQTLSGAILHRIEAIIGAGMIRQIEFRVGVQRRKPVSAGSVQKAMGESGDESAAITDPVMRHVYRVARRKAGA